MTPWFNTRKVAQIVAFFARQEGGSINVLKLTKLVYLADRQNMKKYEFPITGDNLVSMDHGPINSITYNCINGMESDRGEWEALINDRAGYEVGLANSPLVDEELDQLSEAELETLYEVWSEFGHLTQYAIRDWTHKNCPEWENPDGSSTPIPFSRVFKYLGKEHAEHLEQNIRSERKLHVMLA